MRMPISSRVLNPSSTGPSASDVKDKFPLFIIPDAFGYSYPNVPNCNYYLGHLVCLYP